MLKTSVGSNPKVYDDETSSMAHDIARASRLDFEKFGVRYKHGKGIFDVVEAMRAVRHAARGEDQEIAMLAAALISILRPVITTRGLLGVKRR